MNTNEERRCYETVDEMGVEAVLALKRERDALRAEVEYLRRQVRELPRQYHKRYRAEIDALEAQVKHLLDPLVQVAAMQRPVIYVQSSDLTPPAPAPNL